MSYGIGFLLGIVITLILPISVGVYVYRDSNRRGMNAVLWTLVAVFAPSLIGFIIYLVVRESYSDLSCPQCNSKIKEQYVVCPNCGVKLQPACNNCSTVVSPEWRVCPTCTQPLSGDYSDVMTPKKTKDKALSKILVLVILIPIILIVVMMLGIFIFGATSYSSSASGALTSVTYDEFYANEDNEEIKGWLRSARDNNEACAVEYEIANSQGQYDYYYLLYIPEAGELADLSFYVNGGGLFKKVLKLELRDMEAKEEYVYCFVTTHDETDGLELYFNDTKYKCDVKKVDYNPVEDYCAGGTLIEKVNKETY